MQHSKWDKLDKCEMCIMDALFMLDSIIDESDPDVSELASFPGRFFSKRTLGRKKGLVSIAWVIVRMRQI